jgi:Holliday junction resolvase RusA-like endonuclease
MPAKYVKWKADCAKLGVKLPDAASITFCIAMPKSWSEKKKSSMRGQYHQQTPDIDNLIGGLMDAARKNDASVYYVQAVKVWSDTAAIDVMNVANEVKG